MSAPPLSTSPPGHEAWARALLGGLAAARHARPARPVRAPLTPKANCHDTVDAWVSLHAEAQAVHGWLALVLDGGQVRFAAHSLVREADGTLVDPTFSPADPTLPFVPHPRQVGGFFALLSSREPPHELLVVGVPDEAAP